VFQQTSGNHGDRSKSPRSSDRMPNDCTSSLSWKQGILWRTLMELEAHIVSDKPPTGGELFSAITSLVVCVCMCVCVCVCYVVTREIAVSKYTPGPNDLISIVILAYYVDTNRVTDSLVLR